MSSAKSGGPRVGVVAQRPGTGSQVGWSGAGGAPRLSKAKSSPNVSRPTPTLRQSATRIEDRGPQLCSSGSSSGSRRSPSTGPPRIEDRGSSVSSSGCSSGSSSGSSSASKRIPPAGPARSEDRASSGSSSGCSSGSSSASKRSPSAGSARTSRIVAPSTRSPSNVTIVQITPRDVDVAPVPPHRATTSTARNPQAKSQTSPRTEPKRRASRDASASMSCTILEDRALLKKGLSCSPEKVPRKPEALRKKCLSRSTSLWSVPVDAEAVGTRRPHRQSTGTTETRKDTRIGAKIGGGGCLNRTTSLWNVPQDGAAACGRMSRARSVSGLRPSKIPLLTQHPGSQMSLGQSLADLTTVDRVGETSQPGPDVVDLGDEVDHAIGDHIYQNCREAIGLDHPATEPPIDDELKIVSVAPIYENLKESKRFEALDVSAVKTSEAESPRKEIGRTKSANLENRTSFDLEKRAAELMAQLDDDDDDDDDEDKDSTDDRFKVATTASGVIRVDGRRENAAGNSPGGSASQATLAEIPRAFERSRMIAKSQESLLSRREPEISIKEIRRNWEQQIRRSQGPEPPEVRPKPLSAPSRVNSATVNLTKRAAALAESSQEVRKTIANGKRTKDIEQLVNFFNCKNTESTKAEVAGLQDSWAKVKDVAGLQDSWAKVKDSPVTMIEQVTKKRKDKDEKSNGYSSDGNCSEDSGHISNENDVEWKDEAPGELKGFEKGERFLKEIIHDLDTSLERTIEVFDATPIVQRFAPEETKKRTLKSSLSTSSGASSIDSWEETTKSAKRIELARRFEENTEEAATTATRSSSLEVDGEQIFFRSGALERLESQRDEKLTGHIILLQARCRGYLARRKLNTLKLQDLAVRCIQRNVRKLMSVREWPWWRLYVKVAPLLNVHRTEDQLKARTEELEVLRAKVERLEQERNHLKHDNDKLEAKLSVMSADFAEEHSTSTLAAERIDAETSERLRLERELQDVTETNKNLQQTTERLEMELLYARAADLNGLTDLEDGEDGGVYKQRYEHAIRELEFTKRKMAQQHEDDLEQLVGLKKQLEKKLADAYEEVEEQRQVVGQWKRRVQKLNGEMHDLRLLLEEQTARNNLLEKKQRKFDAETQNLMDDLRQEKAQRERLAREKEIAIAEKFTVEQNLSDARLEIELQEERLHTLSQELEELTFGGKTEEEVAQLKKAKHELEKKCKDQEEELDDLAGQVQLLEQAKLRLEMSIEQQRKEMRKEMQQRDEELEDCRGNAHKKVKALESQLENEHEERTILLREKHELERRLVAFEEQDRTDRAAEAETTQRLKRDLKRTRALLRDAQTMLERAKGDSGSKAALRQVKNQLEDAECARAVAVKAKQALEQELNETQAALEEASRSRSEAEERANTANRERTELVSQLEENEEELAEVLKKYRASVQQVSAEQAQLQEAQVQIAALEAEKSSLKDQLSELSQRLESVEQLGDPTANSLATRRLEFRAKELESKLELEQTTRARLETQIARLKEFVDKLQTETALLRTKEQTAQDAARRLQRSLREVRDEASAATAREQEATRARRDLEKALEAAEAETKVARDDLRLALQRIDDLQSAIQGDLDLDCSEEATSENSDSD